MAIVMLAIAALVFARGQVGTTPWTSPVWVVSSLAAVPGLQFAVGQIEYAGVAWMASLFLLGLALTLRASAIWQTTSPGQPVTLLLGSIVFAALVSTGLALSQWLQLDLDIWALETGGARPFANLGQPNQLATFLIWGVIGTTWLWARQHIGFTGWLTTSAFMLFGVALTSSRTAWVILVVLVALIIYWRRYFPSPHLLWGGSALFAWFVFSNWLIPEINTLLAAPNVGGMALEALQARVASEARPAIWMGYLDAAFRKPWVGYGWTQGSLAQIAVLLDHPKWTFVAAHSHNLFLDLVVWMGIPAGLAASGFLVWRLWRHFLTVNSVDQAVILALLVAVGIHAMLELPLHYLNFLLPAGFAWGILEAHQPGPSTTEKIGRNTHWAAWLFATVMTVVVIRDYLEVQFSYQWQRYEWAGLATQGSTPTPKTLVLTQWPDFFTANHRELAAATNADEYRRVSNLAHLYPSAGLLMQLASMQALNGSAEAAQASVRQACQLHGTEQCAAIRTTLSREATKSPALGTALPPEEQTRQDDH